jgi:hypothetical protein
MRKHNPRHLRIQIPDPRSIDELGVTGTDNSMLNTPTFWRALCFLALLTSLGLATVVYGVTWSHSSPFEDFGLGIGASIWKTSSHDVNQTHVLGPSKSDLSPGVQPITHLMRMATKQFAKTTHNQIHSLAQASAQYRKLRRRHPPPGFSAWYTYAKAHNAIINERFWDQIYHDLAPFWMVEPVELRKKVHVLAPRIAIRNNTVTIQSLNQHTKLEVWKDMISTLAGDARVNLPNVDIPLNTNDEPAMLVPWERIDTALSMSRKMMLEPADVMSDLSGLGDIQSLTEKFRWKPEWLGPRLNYPASHLGPRPLWSLIREACAPKSSARMEKVYSDIWDTRVPTKAEHEAIALLPSDIPEGSFGGYVQNWTRVTDVCHHHNLQGLHSAFVSPENMAVATKMFPLFGNRKFGMSNEILIPGTQDWNTTRSQDGEIVDWEEREDKLYWRGESTRAREPQRYWRRFQRERMVSMLNASHVGVAEKMMQDGNGGTTGVGSASNFNLLPANPYDLKAQSSRNLAEWVNNWANAAFTDLGCVSKEEDQDGCERHFSSSTYDVHREAKAKFAIALDDESFISHIRSAKVTLRSSVYRQWYDSRLVPWLHYIPLDNTLFDLYGVMQFFVGSSIKPTSRSGNDTQISRRAAHDDEARRIAEASTDWAEKVLRREDMLIYIYRLVLEYARVLDDRRDRLGWVADLK